MNRILIAEDQPDMRELLVAQVRKVFPTADIWTAKDGLEAWKKFICWKPDLVVTDFLMPKMKGDELAISIQERHHKDVPIILVLSEPGDCKDHSMFAAVCNKNNMSYFCETLEDFRPAAVN